MVDSFVLLDTDVFSYLWGSRPEAAIYRPVISDVVPVLSFVTIAEAFYGALHDRWGERRLEELRAALRPYLVLPYDPEVAMTWARLAADADSRGHRMDKNDLWIAATAVSRGIPLVTNNRSDFAHIADLELLP